MKRYVLALLLLCLSPALAQLSPEAREALNQGQAAMQRALATYREHFIDQNLWQDAIRHGTRAQALAPDSPEVARFLAEAYTTTRWQVRAWDAWLRYAELAPRLDREALRQLTAAGLDLASSKELVGDLAGAIEIYEHLSKLNPDDARAFLWLGDYHLQRNQPQAALPYWQAVLRLHPDDETAQYQVAVISDGVRYGLAAATAFYEGRAAYEAGRLEDALSAFERAATANPQYLGALVQAATISQDLERLDTASSFWQRVLSLEPGSEQAVSALELLREQQRWGVQAVNNLRSGQRAYDEGWMPDASSYFRRAAAANPRYKDAFLWLARSEEALGRPEQAFMMWQQVLRLDPTDAEARAALETIERQSLFDVGINRAFFQGLEHYLMKNLSAAAERFEVATTLTPQHEAAWTYLARVRYEQRDYPRARQAYERVLALSPTSAEASYYLSELTSLLTPEPDSSAP